MTTAVRKAKAVKEVSAQVQLTRVVGKHDFRSTEKKPATNFRCTLAEAMWLHCSNGHRVLIPAGSELVVYRDPKRQIPTRERIATIHHAGGEHQSVIYGGFVGRTQNLRDKISSFGPRRTPRAYHGE